MIPIYKAVFVKMTRNPQKFAGDLESLLNALARDGWNITRLDYDAKKGALVVAHKVDTSSLKIPEGHPLAAFLGAAREPDKGDLMPASKQLLDRVFTKLRELAPAPIPNDKLEKLIPGAVDAVCRKYPNEALRELVTNIRDHNDRHIAKDHKEGGPDCEMSGFLKCIVTAMEKHISQSVS